VKGHEAAGQQGTLIREDELVRKDLQEGLGLHHDSPVEMKPGTFKTGR
jgi:hypothetical protein